MANAGLPIQYLALVVALGCACAQAVPDESEPPTDTTPSVEDFSWVDAGPAQPPPPPTCTCTAGECCDGCDVLPATTSCGTSPVAVEFGCEDSSCGGDALSREQFEYCDGITSVCGNNLVWHDWEVIEACATDALCVSDEGGAACATCDGGCAGAECLCSQGANVAPFATAAYNKGSSAPATYGPQVMNDGADETTCGFSWFYDESPDIGWMELTWASPQTLWGFSVDTASGTGTVCTYASNRTLAGGTVQWWDGGLWVDDGVVSGQTDDWSYSFSNPVMTTKLRIYGAYGSPQGNPVVFEWQAFDCSGP